jgi:transcriptional regulator with XRE-family HTH domain
VGWPVSVATLSRIEHGKGNVSADLLVALSAVFGTPIADLLGSVSAGQIISDDPLTPSEVQAVRRLLAGES